MDEEGACVQQLDTLLNPPRLVYVTPSHNNPLATPMSAARRVALLCFADRHDSLIIENDRMNHYRYATRPIPPLQSLAPSKETVIYLSSFESVLEPLIRLAFVVVPQNLVHLFAAGARHFRHDVPHLDQLVLADMLKSGSLEQHIHRSTLVLANNRRALAIALMKSFRRDVKIKSESVGTCLAIKFQMGLAKTSVIRAASLAGLSLGTTASFYLMQNPPDDEFLVSFANIDVEAIDTQVNEFARDLMHQ